MSGDNRQRRKAEQARRMAEERRRLRRQASASGSEPPSGQQSAEFMIASALRALGGQDEAAYQRIVLLLAKGPGEATERRLVDQVILRWLEGAITTSWNNGWQPADVARIVERRKTSRHARLAVDAIAAQMRRYAPATVDDRWVTQLKDIEATVWWARDDEYIDHWAGREGLRREAAVATALEVLHTVSSLPVIQRLCPLPGTARPLRPDPAERRGPEPQQRVLDRVRALLAKAESTEFSEEAEALTAKAQELMARHSIDAALLAARSGVRDDPVGRRVGIDRPYESAKALLLQAVGDANRCRVVWSRDLCFATVLGYAGDLDAVELLYTSLLVQATTVLLHAGPRKNQYGQSRTRAFRQSFLSAYAIRIGQRLRTATDDASKDAAADARDLLPVLAARDKAVDEKLDAIFPGLVQRRVAINDAEGWASGTAAADLASLDIRRPVEGR